MLRLIVSLTVAAPPELLYNLLMDYKNWNNIFPSTIQQTELIAEENGGKTIRVLHKKEGHVVNWLHMLEPGVIRLDESKPRYNASFINYFDPVKHGSNYTVVASIQLKGIFRFVAPFIKGLVRKRIYQFTLLPMKKAAEKKNSRRN